jgi:hypothetical protein
MTEENHAREQARAQAQSIAAMVAALECDYDRLAELRQAKKDGELSAEELGEADSAEVLQELADLEEAAGDCENAEDARERIQEDPLSVQVRADWASPGELSLTPSEFEILLCTGGPAVRIMGELDHHLSPSRAWIEYQDWGTPWTAAFGDIEHSTLLTYCQQFWFGE